MAVLTNGSVNTGAATRAVAEALAPYDALIARYVEVVGGDPGQIRAGARRLAETATQLSGRAEGLAATTSDQWRGSTGAAHSTTVQTTTARLQQLAVESQSASRTCADAAACVEETRSRVQQALASYNQARSALLAEAAAAPDAMAPAFGARAAHLGAEAAAAVRLIVEGGGQRLGVLAATFPGHTTRPGGGGTGGGGGGGGGSESSGQSGAGGHDYGSGLPDPTDPEIIAIQEKARDMLVDAGFADPREWTALQELWQRESGWRYNADNPTSDAYGIPQALPGSKMVSAGADWQTNPVTQIAWGIGYIKERYGSPSAALAFWKKHNWY